MLCILNGLEVVSHLREELLLIDPAIKLSESLVALVVPDPLRQVSTS